MEINSPTILHPTTNGQALQALAKDGTLAEFTEQFLVTLQEHAKEIGIPHPEQLTATVAKRRVQAVSGATPEQINQLYAAMRSELNCSFAHASRECDTLGTMARFYYHQLGGK